MYNKSNGIASYGRIANFETDPLKQVVMLYDGAIKFLHMSASDIEAGDFAAKAEHSNRALDIINYLQSILDIENSGEVGRSLDDLYVKVKIMILKASSGPNASLMRSAAEALRPVRDAWAVNAQKQAFAAKPDLLIPAQESAYATVT